MMWNARNLERQRDEARAELSAINTALGYDDAWASGKTLAEAVGMLRAQRDELVAALEALSNCYCGSLEGVGGGTRIAPSMTVQLFKDARAAIANVKGAYK